MMSSRVKDEYDEKVQSMKQYLPFLETIISQLENSKKKEHASAAKALYSVLTNPKKRIKMDSLLKMEMELKNLYEKKKHSNSSRSTLVAENIEKEATQAVGRNDFDHAGHRHDDGALELKPNIGKMSSITTAAGRVSKTSNKTSAKGVSILKSNVGLMQPAMNSSPTKIGKHKGLPPATLYLPRHSDRQSRQWTASKLDGSSNVKETSNENSVLAAEKEHTKGPAEDAMTEESPADCSRMGEKKQTRSHSSSASKYYLSRISPPLSPTMTYVARRKSLEEDAFDVAGVTSLDPRLNRDWCSSAEVSADAEAASVRSSSNKQVESEPVRSQYTVSLLKSPSKGSSNKPMPTALDALEDEGAGIFEEKQVFTCQHCSYVGKKIIPHYANRHPGKEMPIRLPEEELEDAINERTAALSTVKTLKADEPVAGGCSEKSTLDDLSWIPDRSIFLKAIDCKMCGYTTVVRRNLIQHLMAHRHPEKNTHGLQFAMSVQLHCRFCEYSVSNVQDFRDHVTAHTGEFFYSCGYCPFRGFSSKSVRSHITCNHVGQPPFVKRDPDIKQRGSWLVGFVCEKCRYIQLSESVVSLHVATSHPGVKVKIIEINMSRSQKQPPVKKNKDSTEQPTLNSMAEEKPSLPEHEATGPEVQENVRSGNGNKAALHRSSSHSGLPGDEKSESGSAKTKRELPTVINLEDDANSRSKIGKRKRTDTNVDSCKSKTAKRSLETEAHSETKSRSFKKRKKRETLTTSKTEEMPETEVIDNNVNLQTWADASDDLEQCVSDDKDVIDLSIADAAMDLRCDYLSDSSDSSPPLLMPEGGLESNDGGTDSGADDGSSQSRIVPSIAETISRLQAILNKRGKPPGPSPPVLEPVDVRFSREKPPSQGNGSHRLDGEGRDKLIERHLYRCGAKDCGSFFLKAKEFLAHLEESHKPREAPCTECSGTFAQWKLLLNHVQDGCEGKEKATVFGCGFSSCPYRTRGEDHFYSHMRKYHKRETQLPCYGCQKTFTLVTSLVKHIKTCCKTVLLNAGKKHSTQADDGKQSETVEAGNETLLETTGDESRPLATGGEDAVGVVDDTRFPALQVVYECPFADCDHKSLEREVFKSHVSVIHGDGLVHCPHCQEELPNIDALIVHLEVQHRDDRSPKLIDMTNVSEHHPTKPSEKQSLQEASVAEETSSYLKITSVMSLSKAAWNNDDGVVKSTCEKSMNEVSAEMKTVEKQVGSLSCLTATAFSKKNPLDKSVPLEITRMKDPSEKGLSLKSKEILPALLVEENLKHLFRCMGFSCLFTTSERSAFFLHLTDERCKPQLTCCYCLHECTTPVELINHIIDSHGHCTFQCKYCFYRAAADDYATLHQQRRHPEQSPGIILCDRHPDAQDPISDPVSTEFVIPYRCAIGNCQFEVTDPLEFHLHNVTDHSSVSLFPCHHCCVTCITPERLLIHYKIHGCNKYQCGFCLHGAETEQDILFHLCSMHPNRRGRLFVRALGENKGSSGKSSEISREEDSSSICKKQPPVDDLNLSIRPLRKTDSKAPNGKNTSVPKMILEMGKIDEKLGHALFVCGYPPCCFTALTAECLREHMVTCPCVNEKNLAQCPHCPRQWRTITVFLEHVVTQHGGRRFICGKCPFRGSIADVVQTHMKRQHGIPVEQTQCALKEGADPEVGEYIVQEAVHPAKAKVNEVRKTERKVMSPRRGASYGIHEIDRLPMQSIFLKEVFCSICGYSTKVRSNLIRHLQLHRREEGLQDVPAGSTEEKLGLTAPEDEKDADQTITRVVKIEAVVKTGGVDRVPDNVKYEVNQIELNQSTGGHQQVEFSIDDDTSNCPHFVPDTSLYRCGVCCEYLALDSVMYRCHVATLHPDNGSYPCPHCSDRPTTLDRLIGHFRLHGPRLYKCGKCSYVNYRRHPVESHNNTVHGNRFLPVIIVREITNDELSKQDDLLLSPSKGQGILSLNVNELSGPKRNIPGKNVWRCALCEYHGPTKNNIKNHLQGSHGVRSEFRCGLCSCVSNAYESVRGHFVAKHPNTQVKIMPLIVRTKDFDPENSVATVPVENETMEGVAEETEKMEVNATEACETSAESIKIEASCDKDEELPSEQVTQPLAVSPIKAPEETDDPPQNGLKIKIDLKRAAVKSRLDSRPNNVHDLRSSPRIVSEEEDSSVNLVNIPSENICVTPDIGFTESSGMPSRKMGFVCPICQEYRTRFRGDMRIHIYRELAYKRVQCMHCKMLFVSEKEAKHHAFKTHRGLPASFQLNEIPEKENWVKEQLDSQVRSWGSIPRNSPKTPKGSEESFSPVKERLAEKLDEENSTARSSEIKPNTIMEEVIDVNCLDLERHFRYCCPQCNYQCEGTTDLRKHIFRHLKFKPFQCNYCNDRFNEKQQMRNHHMQSHPDEEFVCQRDPEAEPERYVDELLQQQRTEWRDRKKNENSALKREKSLAQLRVAKMAQESEIVVTAENGEIQKVYTCKHEGCTFTCSQIKGLKVHLMSHMRKVKYRCGYCSLTGSSQYQLRRHCLNAHATKKILVYALKADTLAAPSQPTKVSNLKKKGITVAKNVHQCPYCPYSHSLLKMISRHMMRHYVEKPFQCGYCKRTGIEKFDILHHCRKVHSDLEPKVISVPMPTNPAIRPILRRGYGYLKSDSDENDGASNVPYEPDQNQETDSSEMVKASGGNSLTERILKTRRTYECNFCHVRLQTKSEVRKHLETDHDERGPRYRVIVTAPKERTPTTNSNPCVGFGMQIEERRVPLFRCDYCDLALDSLQLLQKHSQEVHTGSEVKIKKMASDWEPTGEWMLRCGRCGFAGTKMIDLWGHHFEEHDEKPAKFRTSQRKTGTAAVGQHSGGSEKLMREMFVCSYCNDPCESLEKMKNHWKFFHGHLEFKYNKEAIDDENMELDVDTEENEHKSDKNSDDERTCTRKFPDCEIKLVKVFGCSQCKYESDKYDMVRQHLLRHLQRFMCYVCLKTFPFEYEVKNHFDVNHSGSRCIEVVKNPNYEDRERDELIRNIRTRIADKASLANTKHHQDPNKDHANKQISLKLSSVDDDAPVRRQVARKSCRRGEQKQAPGSTVARTIAKKSASSKLRSPSIRHRLLEQSLVDLTTCSMDIDNEMKTSASFIESETESHFRTCSSDEETSSLSDNDRINVRLGDLYQLANLKPLVRLLGCKVRNCTLQKSY